MLIDRVGWRWAGCASAEASRLAEAFVIMAGGGVDWKLTPLLTWRLVEADYMRFRLDGEWEGDLQLSTALVFTFGH